MLGRFLALTSVGLVVFWFRRDARTLKYYEQTFVDTYAATYTNQVIPSAYHDSKDPQLLAKLCGRSAIRRNLAKSRPRIKIYPISFKTIRKPFLIAEVVHCARNRAIIQAPRYKGHDCAYLLYRDTGITPTFYIHRKFCYMDKKHHRIKRSVNSVKIQHAIDESDEDSHENGHEHDSHEQDSHEHSINEADYPDYVSSHESTTTN